MIKEELNNGDFTFHHEMTLQNWQINGEFTHIVKVYKNTRTNEWYQILETHNKFRKTLPTQSDYDAPEYGEWENFE